MTTRKARPPKKPGLNLKQQRFVAEYLIDLNATAAYIRAGYTARGQSAEVCAAQLLRNPKVAAAVSVGQTKHLAHLELTAGRVLEEIARVAFANVQDFFDRTGNLRPVHALPREHAATLASLEVIKKNAEAGDGIIDTVHKIRLWDKLKALEILAKHFRLTDEERPVDRVPERLVLVIQPPPQLPTVALSSPKGRLAVEVQRG